MKKIIICLLLFLAAGCNSPERNLKAVDFGKIAQAVDEKDQEKSKELLSEQIDSVGKLCVSLKAPKIEMRHVEAVDVYRRLEFMMSLGGFYKVREGLDEGKIVNISDKDREEIKYVCEKLVFDAESILKGQ